MSWIKINDDEYREVNDPLYHRVVSISSLIDEKTQLEKMPTISDEELIQWAKENHPIVLASKLNEKRIDEINNILLEIAKAE